VAELDAKHDFVDSAVEAYSYDGGVWAVPLYNMTMHLWYRPSVLEEAGIAVPTTWEEWRAAAEALTKDGQYGMGLPANKQLYTDQTVYSVMLNGGASEIYNEDGTLRFDNPETVAAYDFYNSMMEFSPPDAASWTWGEAEACFASRACAMIMQFTVISTYDTQAEGDAADLGVAAIPVKTAGRRTRHHRLRECRPLPVNDDAEARGVAEVHLVPARARELRAVPEHGAGAVLPRDG
jgi:multiple sugar transport system substrate-binding protein